MRLLITGAFGNLGQMCIEQALELGMRVRCFDLDTPRNRKLARRFSGRIEAVFGDITQSGLHASLLSDVDAVIHNASLLPPMTELAPELAHSINVEATCELIAAAEKLPQRPVVIFPSSVTVFGLPEGELRVRSPDCAVAASDNYTRHKLAVEQRLAASDLPWVILRVGVSVDARTLSADRSTLRELLNVSADNHLEYVHPRDVAKAMCHAAGNPEATHKILLIGGGASCQIRQRDFLKAPFDALGLSLPEQTHGDNTYYTHWMDTTESQAILQFQNHSFADYQREMKDTLKWIRWTLWPLRPLLNPLLPRLLKAI